MTQQVPTFAGKTSALNAAHRGWISGKVKAGPIRQVICTAIYSSKTNAKDVAIYKLRAQNSCQFAKTVLLGIGNTSKTSVTMSKSTKSAEVGKVYMSFKR
jgi:glucose-6-phosphate dehydrogenase assembly protein OpcA